jgi:hypothetical protein
LCTPWPKALHPRHPASPDAQLNKSFPCVRSAWELISLLGFSFSCVMYGRTYSRRRARDIRRAAERSTRTEVVRDATRAEGAERAVVRDAAHTEVEQVAAHAEGARVVTQIAAAASG